MRSLDKILLVRASGGLSNRLQAILCGIAYCLLTQRAICVDWRDGLYSDDFSNVFPLWFDIKNIKHMQYNDVVQQYKQGATLTPLFWQDWIEEPIAVEYIFDANDHMLPSNVAKTSINLNDTQLAQDIAVFWGWDTSTLTSLVPRLKEKILSLEHLNQFEIERYLLKTHLKPVPSLESEANIFFNKHFSKAPVGIHIRHTDLQSPLPQMIKTLEKVLNADDEIFLCTDNEQIETMMQRLFPRIITKQKIYQGKNVPLHCYVEGISNVQKGFDAILDMLILAKCKHIIYYKHSSFAKIPILLSNLENECIHQV